MKILVIEDEPLVARNLIEMIKRILPVAEIAGPLSSVAAAVNWFAGNKHPDLVFTDIQLADGISFDVFEKIQVDCPIIFTTAYDAYAIRAFKLNSIDYLLKPIDLSDLQRALGKFQSLRLPNGNVNVLRSTLDPRGMTEKKFKERFLTVQGNALIPVLVDRVAFFHKEELIYLHTLDKKKLISDHEALDELEHLLDPAIFFRVNRQYLVHIQSVGKIKSTNKGLTVQMVLPFELDLDISREKSAAFKRWINQ